VLCRGRECCGGTRVCPDCRPSTASRRRRNGSATSNTCRADCTDTHTQLVTPLSTCSCFVNELSLEERSVGHNVRSARSCITDLCACTVIVYSTRLTEQIGRHGKSNSFCRAMLCKHGLSRHAVSVSVCLSVCRVRTFCQNE